jgi:ubiquinone biosynthesis monooxygenase Coq7
MVETARPALATGIIPDMETRDLTPLDQLLSKIDTALRTVAAPTTISPRANPAGKLDEGALDGDEKAHAAGLMRVNHAGEIAAQGLYQGHAAVARSDTNKAQMQAAADEEYDHLAWCDQRIRELGEEPSKLSPVWYAGAFAIGAASGILGDRWSLGFIAETERQVCDHLDEHLGRLPEDDARSRAIVTRMRDEEAQHGENAVSAGAAELPLPVRKLMQVTARLMTTTAYRL